MSIAEPKPDDVDNDDNNNNYNTVRSLVNMYEDIIGEHAHGKTHHGGRMRHPLNYGGTIGLHPR